jgi:hypothetical protein
LVKYDVAEVGGVGRSRIVHLLGSMPIAWLEGDRTFTVIFGTISAGACLAVAIPTLYWCLPDSRKWVFGERADPRQFLQLGFGLFGMAMAFANALCRYIPHRPLGVVHPVFFLTTVSLLVVLTPFVIATALDRGRRNVIVPPLAAGLGALVAAPLVAVVNAFWF